MPRARRKTGTGTYNVTFKSDISKCALNATEATIDDSGRRFGGIRERDDGPGPHA